MGQILSLILVVSSIVGLALLLTRKTMIQRLITLGGYIAVSVITLLVAGTMGFQAENLISFLASFLIIAGIYAILSLGLNIQWGYTGLFNIGVAGFFGVGAYVSTILVQSPANVSFGDFFATYFNQPFLIGLVGAMIASGITAVVVGFATLRLRTDYLAIATIGISEILRLIASNESTLTEATRGIPNIPQPLYDCLVITPDPDPCMIFGMQFPGIQFLLPQHYNWFYFALVLGFIALTLFALDRVSRSPWGRALRAIREDEDAARSLGKDTFRFRMQAFIVGAVIMGAAGSLWAHFIKFIDPQIFDPVSRTFLVWVMLIVGGTGNNKGAIIGAFVMWGVWSSTNFLTGVLPPTLHTPLGDVDVAAQLFGPIRIMAIVVVLELILLFRPRGLVGEEKHTSSVIKS
jgi:branched-chain amino acid transport system permease protein